MISSGSVRFANARRAYFEPLLQHRSDVPAKVVAQAAMRVMSASIGSAAETR
jgi:hypothetical protein